MFRQGKQLMNRKYKNNFTLCSEIVLTSVGSVSSDIFINLCRALAAVLFINSVLQTTVGGGGGIKLHATHLRESHTFTTQTYKVFKI